MAERQDADAAMDAAGYLAWRAGRGGPERFELLACRVHGLNAERAILARTRYAVTRWLDRAIAEAGLACEAMVDGMAVRVDDGNVFESDALVRCGERLADDALVVDDPVVVVEVALPSMQRVDALLKLARYFRDESIRHYLIVMPGDRIILHHRRGEGTASPRPFTPGAGCGSIPPASTWRSTSCGSPPRRRRASCAPCRPSCSPRSTASSRAA